MRAAIWTSVLLGAASLAVIAPAPSYDPWAWLLWGREVAGLELDTAEGPAFKPLPVAVCALLAVFGDAAPALWVAVARAGGALAIGLAFALARELAEGSRLAGALAAAALAATGAFLGNAATGQAEGLLVGLALAGWAAWRHGHARLAAVCLIACGLLRVETWPFLALLALEAGRRHPRRRGWLVATAVAVPAAWFVPEWLGSGDLLRSGARAMVPNPGQPALADLPALASLRAALGQPPWIVWVGLAALLLTGVRAKGSWRQGLARFAGRTPGRAGGAAGQPLSVAPVCVVVGSAWIALVALMAQAGFSGEPRYSLPGAALLAVPGAVGLTAALRRLPRVPNTATGALAVLAVVAATAPQIADLAVRQAYQARLASDLDSAIAAVGGRSSVLACGTPYVGRLRGPLLAHRLEVAKRRVEPDAPPARAGIAFRSALTSHARAAPDIPPGFTPSVRAGLWQVWADCRSWRSRAALPS